MRIIGGEYRGRKIPVPGGFKERPTTDFAREALFNLLKSRISLQGVTAVDLFCGTGAVSLEFVSRGAKRVVAVDLLGMSGNIIRRSSADWGLDQIHFIRDDVFKWVKRANESFNVVFADPPYANKKLSLLPALVLSSQLLEINGWFILEHGPEHDFSKELDFQEMRHYGKVHFSIFRKSANRAEG